MLSNIFFNHLWSNLEEGGQHSLLNIFKGKPSFDDRDFPQ